MHTKLLYHACLMAADAPCKAFVQYFVQHMLHDHDLKLMIARLLLQIDDLNVGSDFAVSGRVGRKGACALCIHLQSLWIPSKRICCSICQSVALSSCVRAAKLFVAWWTQVQSILNTMSQTSGFGTKISSLSSGFACNWRELPAAPTQMSLLTATSDVSLS